jgi:hypothetical protein
MTLQNHSSTFRMPCFLLFIWTPSSVSQGWKLVFGLWRCETTRYTTLTWLPRHVYVLCILSICGSPDPDPTPEKKSTPTPTPDLLVRFSGVWESWMVPKSLFWVECALQTFFCKMSGLAKILPFCRIIFCSLKIASHSCLVCCYQPLSTVINIMVRDCYLVTKSVIRKSKWTTPVATAQL